MRRLDENSGPDNFLTHSFALQVGTPGWAAESERFRASVADRVRPVVPTRRVQDRARSESGRGGGRRRSAGSGAFVNEPDTDFSIAANREWISGHLQAVRTEGLHDYRPVVAGRAMEGDAVEPGRDPSAGGSVAYRWAGADVALVDEAVASARAAGAEWAGTPRADRQGVLGAVAETLARRRGRLLAVMAFDAAKTVREGDPEVSEAIDFAAYYASHVPAPDAGFRPHGTVVVASPWNFPLSIPAGGLLGALAAGNAVIFKPAPETVATAGELAETLWEGGVPRTALQFLPCVDGAASQRLITHPDVDAVVLTGSWETARMFGRWRPGLALHAETSGKNAMVITATADRDEAIADLVHSAFGHAGQKCSAASLAIIEAPVHDDPSFLRRLADAVRSLQVGPAWDLATAMGPLIRPPEGPLLDAFTRLGRGERWLVQPEPLDEGGYLWSPGVKAGVSPGSPFHLTECFGPVLGIMRAADLDQAIRWQNQPAYGLTAGLHALDPAEIERWREAVRAGNLYVNRGTTGAIVRRQPFGGWKRSVVGPGAKAGGPNYVASMGSWPALAGAAAGPDDYAAACGRAWQDMQVARDPTGLTAEANAFRYCPLERVVLCRGSGVTDAVAGVRSGRRGRGGRRRPGGRRGRRRCAGGRPGGRRGRRRWAGGRPGGRQDPVPRNGGGLHPAGRPGRRMVGGRHPGRGGRRPGDPALGARASRQRDPAPARQCHRPASGPAEADWFRMTAPGGEDGTAPSSGVHPFRCAPLPRFVAAGPSAAASSQLLHSVREAVWRRRPVDAREVRSRQRILVALGRLSRPFDEEGDATHVTGSSLILGPRGVILHRHKRLGLWLQPGGHLEPGEAPWEAARREATEETGLRVAWPLALSGEVPPLAHLDVHAGGRGHTHLDLRYVLSVAGSDDPAPPAGESQDVRWFTWPEAISVADPGLLGFLGAYAPA